MIAILSVTQQTTGGYLDVVMAWMGWMEAMVGWPTAAKFEQIRKEEAQRA